jgi:hypothetical protein
MKITFANKVIILKKNLSFKMPYFFVMEGKNPWFYSKKKPKAQVWVLIKAIISFLNHVVLACVMNQSRGHWLLFDALIITLPMNMEVELLLLVGLKSSTL